METRQRATYYRSVHTSAGKFQVRVVWSRVVPSPVACRSLRDSPPRQRSAREFVSDLTGATAVEFALIVPVLLFLVLGTLELGLIIYTNSAAGFATRDVARRIATNRLTASGATDAVKQSLRDGFKGIRASRSARALPATSSQTRLRFRRASRPRS